LALPGEELKRRLSFQISPWATDHRVPGNLLLTGCRSRGSGLGTPSVGQYTTYITNTGTFLQFCRSTRPTAGPIQPLILWVPGHLSQREKWRENEFDHFTPFNIEVKNTWKCASTLPYTSCLAKRRSNFIDMYMSLVPLISYDLGSRTVPYVTSHRGHCQLLIRVSCIT
jgi:hypothetical protein